MKLLPPKLSRPGTWRAAPPARLAAVLVSLGLLTLACGGAESGSALLTIAECEEVGGAPFFDPEDERPAEMSCPAALSYLGEFEEPFFGAEGGICCGGSEATGSLAVPQE